MTFGSIDDVSAPISSSPASAPQVKSEGVKSFGSLPNTHVNGKASLSSRSAAGPSPSSSSIPAVSVPAATPSKPKMDMRKFFQNPPSQPSTSSTSNDTSSPATRPSPLPSHPSSNQSTQPPLTPSSHPTFTPYPRPQQQNTGPSNGPPRSPAYPRQLANGNGPRSQPGPSTGPSPVMSSPRLGSHPPAGMPPPPPPMSGQVPGAQMPWPAYYVSIVLFSNENFIILNRASSPMTSHTCPILGGIWHKCHLPNINISINININIRLIILHLAHMELVFPCLHERIHRLCKALVRLTSHMRPLPFPTLHQYPMHPQAAWEACHHPLQPLHLPCLVVPVG